MYQQYKTTKKCLSTNQGSLFMTKMFGGQEGGDNVRQQLVAADNTTSTLEEVLTTHTIDGTASDAEQICTQVDSNECPSESSNIEGDGDLTIDIDTTVVVEETTLVNSTNNQDDSLVGDPTIDTKVVEDTTLVNNSSKTQDDSLGGRREEPPETRVKRKRKVNPKYTQPTTPKDRSSTKEDNSENNTKVGTMHCICQIEREGTMIAYDVCFKWLHYNRTRRNNVHRA